MKGTKHRTKQNLIYHQLWLRRRRAGLTQQQLAEKMRDLNIYCTAHTISEIEHNVRYVLDYELAGLCKIFDVSPEELMNQDGQ